MFDPKSYREACGQLTLGAEKIEEMISMTENKKKFSFGHPARVMVLAAALTAALGISAFAASPAGQEFIESVKMSVFVVVDSKEDGTFDITQVGIPDASISTRDGRTILTVDGEEMDITDQLEKDGEFVYASKQEDGSRYELTVDSEGVARVKVYDENGDEQFTFDLLSGDNVTYGFVPTGEGDCEVVTSTWTFTGDVEGGVTVTDKNSGTTVHYDSIDDIPAVGLTD